MDEYKQKITNHYDALAKDRNFWRQKNEYYYEQQTAYFQFLVPKGKRVLEIGCGTGDLLNDLQPEFGMGIDISEKMVDIAAQKYPGLHFFQADAEDTAIMETLTKNKPFDFIILSDAVGLLEDVQRCFENLRLLCDPHTRIIVSYYNVLWEPLLKLGEKMKWKMPTRISNWLSCDDINNLLALAGFEPVKEERRLLVPKKIPLLRPFFELIGTFPFLNLMALTNYIVARPAMKKQAGLADRADRDRSVSVIVPCKNEKGNIEPLVKRLPLLGSQTELIFIDGHSIDGTPDEIQRVIKQYPGHDIKFLVQDGRGKGDAVRKAFAAASNDILMILDADITVSPEDLPKFYNAIINDNGEFINGCRLVYPMEDEAMRFLNILGNKFFSWVFSWLLNQRIKDTLCGTKVLTKAHYDEIAANREYFGDFDPFGDFDLLFGASKLNLKIVEVPVRYNARQYGETQISRFSHGWLLLKMSVFAIRKLKWI